MKSANRQNKPHHDDDRARLLAKVIREILASPEAADYGTVADVIDALKWRCARMRIGWTNDAISAAVRMVASNVALPANRVLDARRRRIRDQQRTLEYRSITRAEAAAILHRLGVHL